jgi:hypothetical protein
VSVEMSDEISDSRKVGNAAMCAGVGVHMFRARTE